MPNYIELPEKELIILSRDLNILIMTATSLETKHTHDIIKPLEKYESIIKISAQDITLYFGIIGNFKICQVQSGIGSSSRNGSTLTTKTALQILKNLKAIIMVGIAFGMDSSKQKIGDILVSESIIPYDSKKEAIDKTIHRGTEILSCKILLNRLKALDTENNFSHEISFTKLLSGETLIDNINFRDKLRNIYPESKGGEMEGVGIASACDSNISWIIIKSICDFADGNKSKNKDENQEYAIGTSLELLKLLFNSKDSLNALGIKATEKVKLKSKDIEQILFEIYKPAIDQYYLNRNFDNLVGKEFSHYYIWIYGDSGMGKTNSILRNLYKNDCKFLLINLAPYSSSQIDEYFAEIAYEITNYVNNNISTNYESTFINSIKSIVNSCKMLSENERIYIYIEEIPLNNITNNIIEFSQKLLSLILKLITEDLHNRISFVLSSIASPSLYNIDRNQHQKFTQYFKLIDIGSWTTDEIESLNEIICTNLGLTFSQETVSKIIEKSKNSPRFIKRFYRNLLTINSEDEKDINETLQSTYNEYFS